MRKFNSLCKKCYVNLLLNLKFPISAGIFIISTTIQESPELEANVVFGEKVF